MDTTQGRLSVSTWLPEIRECVEFSHPITDKSVIDLLNTYVYLLFLSDEHSEKSDSYLFSISIDIDGKHLPINSFDRYNAVIKSAIQEPFKIIIEHSEMKFYESYETVYGGTVFSNIMGQFAKEEALYPFIIEYKDLSGLVYCLIKYYDSEDLFIVHNIRDGIVDEYVNRMTPDIVNSFAEDMYCSDTFIQVNFDYEKEYQLLIDLHSFVKAHLNKEVVQEIEGDWIFGIPGAVLRGNNFEMNNPKWLLDYFEDLKTFMDQSGVDYTIECADNKNVFVSYKEMKVAMIIATEDNQLFIFGTDL